MTWRTLFRLTVLACSLTLLSPATVEAAGPPKVRQVSSDPFTNPSSQHQTEVESQTVAAGSTVVAIFQAGRFFAGGGSSGIGFTTSHDAGASWTKGFLPGLTIYSPSPGAFVRVTDAAVAFDARHAVWLASSLDCTAPDCASAASSILVNRSTDGGLTWTAPLNVFAGGILDHPWIACDSTPSSPFYGRCYVSIVNLTTGHDVTVHSDDGGLTWSAPVTSAALGGIQTIVQPNGTLVIVGFGITTTRSTDGGMTFSAPVIISLSQLHGVVGMRATPAPALTVDAAGLLYAYWHDCRFRAGCSSNDIVYSTSSDALTWSSVVRIPIDKVTSGVDHFIPGLGVDPATSGTTAHLALTFYFYPNAACTFPTPDTCRLEVGFTSSSDGGKTWSNSHKLNHRAMDLAWLPNTTLGHMVGDYLSTAFAGGHTVSVFAIALAPAKSGALQEAMYAAVG
ncbi:MAG TPA: sialidase family protein [Candidatus Dormibacteraeota bacterium]|nr:sialidase family protein [Candidatus Dormibacteraeota bacterium]